MENADAESSSDFTTEELTRAVAKLIVFGFSGKSINAHARQLIAMGAGGVIFFARNVRGPQQVSKLSLELKREAGSRNLIVMIDQEGGTTSQLGPPFTPVPAARVLGKTGKSNAAAAMGFVLGKELRSVNIDMDLAPVLDVDTHPQNPIIGERSFGESPSLVSKFGYSFIKALQQEGVAACAKHFPGHGDTVIDSHVGLPFVLHGIERLQRIELPPFQEAVEAGVAAVMLGHIVVPCLKSKDEGASIPASLSKGVVDYLRNTLSFKGLVLSGCLEMRAITKYFSAEEAAIQAVLAGVDMLLICHTRKRQERVIRGLVQAVSKGRIPYKCIIEAGHRIDSLAEMYCCAPVSRADPLAKRDQQSHLHLVGCKDHNDMIADVLHF